MYLTPKFDGIVAAGVSGIVGIPGAPIQALTATGQIYEFVPNDGISLEEISFVCTTTVSSSSNPVISAYSRPTAGISGSDVLLGTLTVPSGLAAGAFVYRKVSETAWTIPQKGALVFACTTAASSAGKGFMSFKCGQTPENVANVTSGTGVTG